MTETTFLPGSGSSDVDNTTMAPPFDGEDETPDRRRLMLIGGAAGIVVLIVAALLLLRGGSNGSPTLTTVPRGTPHSAASNAPTPAKKVAPKRGSRVTARDPFQALVAAPVSGGTAAGGTTTVPAGATAGTTAPVSTLPTTAPTTGSGSTSLGSPAWIELLRTNGSKSATFKVGYHHHTFKTFRVDTPKPGAQQGTVFANDFALIGVQNGMATVQVGDSTPFDLEPGFSHPV